jgi:UDP-N-acetylglucosamine pyrophosphorylase
MYEKFKKEGKDYIFISNIDNLGATIDINICKFILIEVNYLIENEIGKILIIFRILYGGNKKN